MRIPKRPSFLAFPSLRFTSNIKSRRSTAFIKNFELNIMLILSHLSTGNYTKREWHLYTFSTTPMEYLYYCTLYPDHISTNVKCHPVWFVVLHNNVTSKLYFVLHELLYKFEKNTERDILVACEIVIFLFNSISYLDNRF